MRRCDGTSWLCKVWDALCCSCRPLRSSLHALLVRCNTWQPLYERHLCESLAEPNIVVVNICLCCRVGRGSCGLCHCCGVPLSCCYIARGTLLQPQRLRKRHLH
jgi:hypothetical protein